MTADQRNLPALLRAAERRVNAHVFRTGGDDSLASIPANRDRDVDLLLMEAAEEIERLREGLTLAREWLQGWGSAAPYIAGIDAMLAVEPEPPLILATMSECCGMVRIGKWEPGVIHNGGCRDRHGGELGETIYLVRSSAHDVPAKHDPKCKPDFPFHLCPVCYPGL